MDALKIGDHVKGLDGSYSRVYSFGHRSPNGLTKFLEIHTNSPYHDPLEVTPDHLLYMVGSIGPGSWSLVPAKHVKVGSFVAAMQQESHLSPSATSFLVVTDVREVLRHGAYAPFTVSGNIVVNGVSASNYIALPEAFAVAREASRRVLKMRHYDV